MNKIMAGKIKFNLIAAACDNNGIGINGNLPWRLKNELKYFNKMTTLIQDSNKKNAVIMGRKTYFGIPESKRPLPNRINVVLSRNPAQNDYPDDVIVCSSLQNAVERLNRSDLKNLIENIWIVGGSSVYKEAMDSSYFNRLYFTKIMAPFECDTFFPDIPKTLKIINGDENVPQGIQEENGIKYEYQIYEKV